MSARTVSTAALAVATIVLAGCSASLTGGGAPEPARTTAATAPGTAAAGSESATTPAPVVAADPFRNVLGRQDVPMPLQGDTKATLRVDLLSLKRDGRVITLTAAFTPTHTLTEQMSLYNMLGDQGWQPTLIDVDNLKLYSVLSGGSAGRMQSNDLGDKVPSGAPLLVHAVFAAPPPGVTAVNVQVADQVPTFERVRIG
jgi:hypothetical protein